MSFAIHQRGFRTPGQRVYRHVSPFNKRETEFTAERGMISVWHREASGQEEFQRVGVGEFLNRALALNDEIPRCQHKDERREHRRVVDMMIAVAKEAREQGDPFVPGVIETMAGSPRSVTVGFSAANLTPMARALPPIPRPTPGRGLLDHNMRPIASAGR